MGGGTPKRQKNPSKTQKWGSCNGEREATWCSLEQNRWDLASVVTREGKPGGDELCVKAEAGTRGRGPPARYEDGARPQKVRTRERNCF